MRFADINMAHLFWIVLPLIVFMVWSENKRAKITGRFIQKKFLSDLAFRDLGKGRLKKFFLTAAIIFSIFALMRPQWGFHLREVKRKGLDILIAVDTSKSMLARDVKPDRLERAKLAMADFVSNLSGDRVGLITFAGSAFLECPLTSDYRGFLLSVNSLDVDNVPKGGTSLTGAINEAVKGYKGALEKYKVLIIITDGEDHEGGLDRAIEDAKKEGIKIFTIGIGTSQGELIPVRDGNGNESFLKDNEGKIVKTRLNEKALKEIALKTGGSYVHAGGADFGLNLIYEKKLSKMERRDLKSRIAKRYEERFLIPLLIALVFLIFESMINERRKSNE